MTMKHTSRTGRIAALMLVAIALIAQYGCSSTPTTNSKSDGFNLTLDFAAQDETGSDRLYRVDSDGAISFGGGFQALVGNTSWTGQLTKQEEQELLDVIRQQAWFASKIESTNEPKDRVYRVTVRTVEGHRRFKVVGANERVAAVEAVLERICRQRFDEDLKRLPTPSIEQQQPANASTQPASSPSP
jgi:hypothetical protein